ncbi:hypothetical protein [Streptomyces sp. NPDC005732]|uniref:hypothetical protein n=1 Tax=Streptomyces sp. NPDC005732 TaxID=3157057 RepID=UPI0033FDD650
MSSARKTPPPPDMSGVSGDWRRLQELRRSSDSKADDQGKSKADDAMTSGAHDATVQETPAAKLRPRAGRTRGGRRPPPAAADAVPTTVRFDLAEATENKRFVLGLQDETGRRTLDQSEVIRELLRMAREHEPTRKALLRRLR